MSFYQSIKNESVRGSGTTEVVAVVDLRGREKEMHVLVVDPMMPPGMEVY